jgi:hypothetical protein
VKKINIRWDSERAGYYVSEPGWDGGDVYLASDADARIAELQAAFQSSSLLSGEVIEERNRRIAELEREVTHLTRQRDQTAEKLHAAEARIQALSFG